MDGGQRGVSSTGYRWFESISLQQRVGKLSVPLALSGITSRSSHVTAPSSGESERTLPLAMERLRGFEGQLDCQGTDQRTRREAQYAR
jgi:hypothetical protein